MLYLESAFHISDPPPPFYGAGQVFLKGEGAGNFPIKFFQGLSFVHLEITLPFAKLCHAFEEKKNFSVTIIS